MENVERISLENSKKWNVSLLNPFMMAMLLVFASMYAIYCLGIGIPESILPLFFVVVVPFFKKADFIALGACLPLISGIPHFRVFLILVVAVYFIKYYQTFKIRSVWWFVLGFVVLEIFDSFQNDYFAMGPFVRWSGMLFYFALCINLLPEIKPTDMLRIMKCYVMTYCCAAVIILQRFAAEAGGLLTIITDGKRLGDMRNFYGFDDMAVEVSNGLSFNPNWLGILSVLCFGICLLFIYLHHGRCWLWIGIAGFATMVILMTQSRGAMVAWMAVMLIYFFDFRSLRKIFTIAFMGTFFVFSVGFVLYSCSDSFAMMFDNMLARFTMDGDITAGRLVLWELWNKYFFSRPSAWLTGIGGNNIMKRLDDIGIFNCIHGGFQEAYVYWGFIGLFLMFALNWSIYKIAKKTAGGHMTKLNFLLMLAAWLQLSKGQYMSGDFNIQIIAACVMAYPFWKYQDGSSEYGVRSERMNATLVNRRKRLVKE